MKDPDCIFCKIIAGEIPSAKVFEDNDVLAFLDINPVNRGHTLIIPKKHSENLLEMDEDTLNKCIKIIKKVAKSAMDGVRCDGFNIGMNNYPAAGQVLMHSHFHVIPRFEGDGFKHWPQGRYADDDDMEDARKAIQERMDIQK